jgi:pyridoxamine 5'-phosphate oxidase family protein
VIFTNAEHEYLVGHPLGRLATIGPDGAPQVHPVAFWVEPDSGVILIGGPELTKSQKYRNVESDPRVSFVVDDQSEMPNPIGQTGRGIEIRGRIEIVTQAKPLVPGFGHEALHLHPHRIVSWNIGEFRPGAPERPPHMQGYSSRDVYPPQERPEPV